MNDVRGRIRQYIHDGFLAARPDFDLTDSQPLVSGGVMDSVGMAELIVFLESEFGIMVNDADMTEERLGTVERLAEYVAARRGAP